MLDVDATTVEDSHLDRSNGRGRAPKILVPHNDEDDDEHAWQYHISSVACLDSNKLLNN
jgi:hypothetical protein